MAKFLRRLLTPPLMLLASLLFFFEEWLWNGLQQLMARLGRWPVLRQGEAWLAGLPPAGALLAFLLPGLLILPVKLLALHWLMSGHVLAGLGLILAAKLAGMAFFSRIFVLCRPSLLTVPRFKRLYDLIQRWQRRCHDFINAWQPWQHAKARLAQWRQQRRSWLSRRWQAIRKKRNG